LKREAARRARQFPTYVNRPKETLASFTKEWNRIEQERKDAPAKAAAAKLTALQEEHQQLLREVNNDIRAYWSTPLGEIDPKAAVADTIGQYVAGAPLDAEDTKIALAEFFDGMAGNKVEFSPEAAQKLGEFMRTLSIRLGVPPSLPNLVEAVHRLVDLGAFRHGVEITGFEQYAHKPVPKETPAPAPVAELTVDEIALSTETREGRKAHLSIVNQQFFQRFAAAYSEFYSECKAVFEGFDLTDTEAKYLADLIDRRNLAPTAANFHKVRVLAAKSRHIRPWLTNPERYEIEVGYLVENTPVNGTADRIDLNRRIAELKQKYAVA
jgi:hypothetical protein